MLQQLTKDNLHHTNVCIGKRSVIIADIDALVSTFSATTNHVERLVYEYDKFLIADARHIFSVHLHKTAKDSMQIICIAFNSTNIESQNSLLKMLEEPRPNTYFFIIVPSKKIILDTVLSRAQVFLFHSEIQISESTKEFISSGPVQRLEYVKSMLDDFKTEKITKQNVIEFVEEIEKYVHSQKNTLLLKRILNVKEYLKDQGASVKQLLEYVALQI